MGDLATTNAALAQAIADLVATSNARWDQFADWLGGTATGGASGDGRYPLTDSGGNTELVPCPAAITATGGSSSGQSLTDEQVQAAFGRMQALNLFAGFQAA